MSSHNQQPTTQQNHRNNTMMESLGIICHIVPIVKAIGYAQQSLTANGHTILSRNNLRYAGARFSYGASENSVSMLGPHGERSLGVSPVRILRMTGEGRGVNGIRSRRSSIPQCKVQREAPPRRTINRIQKKKKKKKVRRFVK
jgi:hypothetical protein